MKRTKNGIYTNERTRYTVQIRPLFRFWIVLFRPIFVFIIPFVHFMQLCRNDASLEYFNVSASLI